MTFLEVQRAAQRGGHRLVDGGRTPNGLYRMLVCARCGGKILARSPDEARGDIAMWSCTPGEARALTPPPAPPRPCSSGSYTERSTSLPRCASRHASCAPG